MKKAESNTLAILAIFALAVIVLLVIFFMSDKEMFQSLKNNTIIQNTTFITEQPNICDRMTRDYPAYFSIRETQCNTAGGDYICQKNKAGCFDVPAPGFNIADCDNTDIMALQGACRVLDETWVCDGTNVGCYR